VMVCYVHDLKEVTDAIVANERTGTGD
jgi:hypothetical protein